MKHICNTHVLLYTFCVRSLVFMFYQIRKKKNQYVRINIKIIKYITTIWKVLPLFKKINVEGPPSLLKNIESHPSIKKNKKKE